ncbi:MAG: methyltransferase domain-containing protein [Chloroflexi bacterium]|nr:methyltransferase domain-containing protein [Chloroflexota bacterium]
MSDVPPTTASGERWRAMLDRAEAQAERVRDPAWQDASDRWQPHATSFRATAEHSDPAVVEFLLAGLRPEDTVLDVGAGAGRFSLPVARVVRRVVAVEPSPAMVARFLADLEQQGVDNVEIVETTWEEAPPVNVDAAFAAHVVYHVRAIEAFVLKLDRAVRRWAALVVFADAPQAHLSVFWERVHGERRAPGPHLPQLLDVLGELGVDAVVQRARVPLWPLGPPERARDTLRRRLYVRPDSPADVRLRAAMAELLDERDGLLAVRGAEEAEVGLVRWGK